MKILLYVRKWNKNFYYKLAKSAFDSPQIQMISDFRGLADVWSGTFLYDEKYDTSNSVFEKEKADIIARCRFLRSLPYEKAEKLSNRFWNGVQEIFNKEHYDIVISPIIDCYTMDIIERVAEQNGVMYFSLVTSFIQGYSRFTKRGELFDAGREVNAEEVNSVLNTLLRDDYKVSFSLNREKKDCDTLKYYLRRRVVDNIYFPLMKLKEKDIENYHYNTLSFQDGRYNSYNVKNAQKYYKKIDSIKINNMSVYVPLHYSPEATVDYWCDDKRWADYEASVVSVIEKSDKQVEFIVKEHPAMYGKRCIRFYQKLEALGNVQMIHPYENSNYILGQVNNVLTYTGSVGVEALLRGKKVFTVSDNYYFGISPNTVKVDQIKKTTLVDGTLRHDNYSFMHDLLSGMFKGKSTAGADIEKSDLEEIAAEMHRIYSERQDRKFR